MFNLASRWASVRGPPARGLPGRVALHAPMGRGSYAAGKATRAIGDVQAFLELSDFPLEWAGEVDQNTKSRG